MTRRLFLTAACAAAAAGAAPVSFLGRARHYVADATLLIFSRPTLSRANVGAGWCGIETTAAGSSRLVFAGGSLPERARGMHWLGLFEESLGDPLGPSYFGFMSTQPGHTGLQPGHSGSSRDTCWYKASRGTHRDGAWRSVIREIPMPAMQGFRQCDAVANRVRAQIAPQADSHYPNHPPRTLMGSILEARRAHPAPACSETTYFANGKTYRLLIRGQSENEILRLDGAITDYLGAANKGRFKVWFAPQDDLPVRIEFHPRPYLQLTLRLPKSGEAAALLQEPSE